ncbi:SRPBCC family protein [Streptosporangium sp. NPDC050855]|uniref:SRPBCC family protein n=1 Tax=Streptosporangium sp. NPDC050855 TaxID=3366194 RepID=UPI003793C963
MGTITGMRVVRTSLDTAARLFLDWSHDPLWRAQVRRMDVEPPGRAVTGQRIVEELRFAGLTFVTPTRVERAGPTFAQYRGGGATVTVSGSRRLEARPDGVVALVATLDVRLRGPLRPLTGLLIPSYRRLQEDDLDRLAAILGDGVPDDDLTSSRSRPASGDHR